MGRSSQDVFFYRLLKQILHRGRLGESRKNEGRSHFCTPVAASENPSQPDGELALTISGPAITVLPHGCAAAVHRGIRTPNPVHIGFYPICLAWIEKLAHATLCWYIYPNERQAPTR